jgi:hypothetical protein
VTVVIGVGLAGFQVLFEYWDGNAGDGQITDQAQELPIDIGFILVGFVDEFSFRPIKVFICHLREISRDGWGLAFLQFLPFRLLGYERLSFGFEAALANPFAPHRDVVIVALALAPGRQYSHVPPPYPSAARERREF